MERRDIRIEEVKNNCMSTVFPYDTTLKVGDFVRNSDKHRDFRDTPVVIGQIIELYSRDYRNTNPLAVLKIIIGNPDNNNYDVHWLVKITKEEAFVEGL